MKGIKKIVIVGVPNVGKSTVFNHITQKYSITANYPNTTVEEQRTNIKLENEQYEVIDTPGVNSLAIFSEDELLVRNILIEEEPSIIIQCVDAVNIKRSLLLTAELIELNIPLLICLNFIDETLTKGIWVDSRKLENILKVPVVEMIASQGNGIDKLITRITNTRVSNYRVRYNRNIENMLDKILTCFPISPSPAVLLLILSGKTDILNWVETKYGKNVLNTVKDKVREVLPNGPVNVRDRILEARNNWVEDIALEVFHRSRITLGSVSEKIGEIVRHPVWGWPILAGVLFIIYILVGQLGAVYIAGWFGDKIFNPLAESIGRAIPWQFLRELLVGKYGILSIGLFNAIGTVLPILSIFFLLLSFLEDIGYITNLCVLVNRFLNKIGLSGKAVLPFVLGFGCKTVAILTTRTLDSWKERYIAIFLIVFCTPCSAQLGMLIACLAFFPISATIIIVTGLLTGEIIAGIILNKSIKSDKTTDFIMEIPPIRFPNLKNMGIKVYYRLKLFFQEAIPLFLIGAFALFTIDKLGILKLAKIILRPIMQDFLSLPIDALDGFLLSMVRLEQGAALILDLVKNGQFDYISIIVCSIVIIGFVPCINAMAAITKVLKIKTTIIMIPIITASAVLVGGAVNWILRLFM